MDKGTRNTLRNVVTRCRRLLEDVTADLLEGQFGVYRDGRVEEETGMAGLDDERRTRRLELLAHLAHIRATGMEPADAAAQLTREVAYTHLNRLCAYKMMERRKVIPVTVSKGLKSN